MKRRWLVAAVITLGAGLAVWMCLRDGGGVRIDRGRVGGESETPPRPSMTDSSPVSRAGLAANTTRPSAPRPFSSTEEGEAARPIRVQVVDEAGHPLGGVGVLLVCDQAFRIISTVVMTARDTGLAEIRARREWMSEERRHWIVTVDALLASRPDAAVDPMNPPAEPIRLVIGPTGRVVVRLVDSQKNPVLEPAMVDLRLDPDPRSAPSLPRKTGRGEVVFERVGVGTKLMAQASVEGRRYGAQTRCTGPEIPGEEVVRTITIDVSRPFITARVLDPGKKPIPDTNLRAVMLVTGDSRQNTIAIHTDSAGRFRAEIVEDVPQGGERKLTVRHETGQDTVDLEGVLDLTAPLSAGDNDLGEVVLAAVPPPPLIVAGIVLDDQDRPVACAGLRLNGRAKREPGARHDPIWDRIPGLDHLKPADEAGRFEIHGSCDVSELRIDAWMQDGWGDNPVEFQAGRKDLVLRVHAGGALEGSVRLPAGLSAGAIEIVARLEDDSSEWKAYGSGYWQHPDDDGSFRFRSLRAASFSVTLTPKNELFLPVVISGIAVKAGETTRDPRLQNIEIPSRGRPVYLTVVDPERKDVRGAQAAVLGSESMGHKARQELISAQEGRIRIFLRGGSCDVMVGAPGFQRKLVTGVTEDQKVVLDRGIQVRLKLLCGVAIPKDRVALDGWLDFGPTAGNRRDVRPEDLVGRTSGGAFDVTTRELLLGVSEPGLYRVGAALTWTTEHANAGAEIATSWITVTESSVVQEFVITADVAAVEALLRKMEEK